MINKLIENYIRNMNVEDVRRFANDNGIYLNSNEINIIYKTIKEDWYTLVYGDQNIIFDKVRPKLNQETYKKAEELFFYFKNKYQRFL